MSAPLICGANLPSGPCSKKPEDGKRRCRLHGGAKGSGAPRGNQNAYKHGLTTKVELEDLKAMNAIWNKIRLQLPHVKKRRRKKHSGTAKLDNILESLEEVSFGGEL